MRLMPATVLDSVTPGHARLPRGKLRAGRGRASARVTSREAVALANDTEYGLSAAVFTRDMARALEVARQIDSGICHINGPTVHDEPQMPFGGARASGYGRFGGKAGIDGIHRTALDHGRHASGGLPDLRRGGMACRRIRKTREGETS